jgi:hypothetical protein
MIQEHFSEIAMTELPPMRVACYRAVSKTPEDDAMSVLQQWMAEAGMTGLPRNFGRDIEVTAGQAAAGLRGYELWFQVRPGVWPAPPVVLQDFDGGRAACLTIADPFTDPFLTIPTGWRRMEAWAQTEGIDASGRLCLEEVIDHDGRRDLVLYLMLD